MSATESLRLPEPWRRLPNGLRGWYQRGENDCLEACVASVLRVALVHVPDLAGLTTGEALAALERWADQRLGSQLTVSRDVPLDHPLWIGVERRGEDGYRHTVVMSHGDVLHNPASGFEPPPGCSLAPVGPIEFGVTFQRKDAP